MSCKLSEKKNVSKTVSEALELLNKKNFALIIHGGSFPSEPCEDIGFGNMNSSAAKRLIDFASGIFNAIQLGPAGKTKGCDSSPYTGTIFSINPLFIDLKQLTQQEWGHILPEHILQEAVENNPNKNLGKTAYSYVYKVHASAMREAYDRFRRLDLAELKEKFEKFKFENAYWLEKDALYEALAVEHANDYWPLWQSKVDKNLFNPKSYEEKILYAKRIDALEKKYPIEIDFYCFCQFVVSEQCAKTRDYALSKGIKLIADRQVAFSDRDTWAYQSLFLDGWLLGCPPDYFSNDGQAWGFPVLNPEMLFNKDGSLGEGGLLMKNLFKKMFKENPGGVRIDHIVGLIDPWVYKKGHKPKIEEGAGRLYSSPEHPILAEFAIPSLEDLNTEVEADKEQRVLSLTEKQIELYGRLIEKIVIAAAEEEGLDKDAIVCEDLGTLTRPVEAVMKKYDLQGMRLTQFVDPESSEHPYRGSNISERSWAMVGTHDNEPALMWAEAYINTHQGYLHARNLAEDLFNYSQNHDDIIVDLTQNAKLLAQIKIVELFASKSENIQIFFTDFFGIKDVYNRPGTSGDENWSLRLANDFEELYCKNIKDGTALNLPVVLEKAVLAQGEKFSEKNAKLVKKLKELQE